MNYEEQTRAAYQDRQRAEAYHAQFASRWTWARLMMWRERRLVLKALRMAELRTGETVLDFPCGSGVLGNAFARAGALWVGADVAAEMMDIARRTAPNARFVRADICHPPFPAAAFRLVATIGLMHRLPKMIRREALLALRGVTSGYLVVSFTISSPLQRAKRRILASISRRYGAAPHPEEIGVLLEECTVAGFAIERVFEVAPLLSSEVIVLLRAI